MKKYILVLFFAIIFSSSARAFDFPDFSPLGPSPQLCAQCTSERIKVLQSSIQTVKQISTREGRKSALKDVTAHAKSYASAYGNKVLKSAKDTAKSKISGLLKKGSNGEPEKPISYTRMIRQTKTDLASVENVKESFKKYFLYIPSNDEEIRASYKEKREQFIEDTTIELFITAKEMDKELKDMIVQLDLIEKCIIRNQESECQASDMEQLNCQKDDGSEDEMCHRRNLLMVASIYDTIMKYNEYLIAMRSQYDAIQALEQGVTPVEFGKEKKKVSLSIYKEESSGYAAQEVDEDNESLIVNEIPDSQFDNNYKTGLPTPLAEKEGDSAALATFHKAQDYISDAIVSHNLKFQLPEFKRQFESYHDLENTYNRALKQVYESQQCVLNYLSKRYEDPQKVWFDNCAVDESSGYVCNYNPAKSMSDSSESRGIYDVRCPNASTQKCYRLSSEQYKEIGGMSGWLVNMYLNAKDELSDSSVDSDDYVVYATSVDEPQVRTPEEDTDVYAVENMKRTIDGGRLLIDKYKEDMRVLSRLTYSIGMKADEVINQDTNGVSGTSKFGTGVKKPFPIWNDQIRFYDQYIDGKYQNIKEYFEKAPLFENILALGLEMNKTYNYQQQRQEDGSIISPEEQRSAAEKAIKEMLGLLANDGNGALDEIEAVLAEEKSYLQEVTNAHMQRMQAINNDRIALYRQLEDVNINLSNINNEVSKQDSVIDYATNYTSVAKVGAENDKAFQTPQNPHKTIEEELRENMSEQKSKEQQAESAREAAVSSLDGANASRENILNAIKNKEKELQKERSDYVLLYYNAEHKFKQKLDDIITAEELSEAAQKAKEAIGSLEVLTQAQIVTELLRAYAVAVVNDAEQEIGMMKVREGANSLYYAENNGKVVKIHTEMLNKIINPSITDIVGKLGLPAEKADLIRQYSSQLTKLFSGICDEVSCFAPDSKYFVGLIAQEKDFAAPAAPTKASFAPLREIFSFGLEDMNYVDMVITDDLKLVANEYIPMFLGLTGGFGGAGGIGGLNAPRSIKIIESEVAKGKDASINSDKVKVLLIGNSLLDSGIEIPEIWRVVLSYRPFVQKNIDMEKFLENGGAESRVVARSGIYPCLSGNNVVDVIPVGGGEVRYTILKKRPENYASLQECKAVRYDGSTFVDVQADEGRNTISGETREEGIFADYSSELGQILKYENSVLSVVGKNGLPIVDAMGIEYSVAEQKENGYLTFRDEVLTALRKISQVEDIQDITAEYYLYKRVLFQNSQLADYLNKMEEERMKFDSANKMKNKLYSSNIDDDVVVNLLYRSFAAMGYDFDRQTFDLSIDEHYKQAEHVLNERKEKDIALAKQLLQGDKLNISIPEIEKRREDLLHQIKMLETDADEIVHISSPVSIEELEENIKNQKADNAVLEANKVKAGYIREEPVYCSAYE